MAQEPRFSHPTSWSWLVAQRNPVPSWYVRLLIPCLHLLILDPSQQDRNTIQGYLFSPLRFRRTPTFFAFDPSRSGDPQVKIEEQFSKIYPGRLNECTVIVDNAIFLVAAHWADRSHPNLAVKTVCRGLEWRGEVAIVQVGQFTPYYKRIRNPSAVNKAISRYVFNSPIGGCVPLPHFL